MATEEQYGTYSNNMGFSVTINGPPNNNGYYLGSRDGRPSTKEYYPGQLAGMMNQGGWTFVPLKPPPVDNLGETIVGEQLANSSYGGRRSRKNRGANKGKTRKGSKMLSSWVSFVKKVQHEEKISYSDAMKRASARKKEWKMGQMGGQSMPMANHDMPMANHDMSMSDDEMEGGRRTRRRRTKRGGSKKRCGTKRRR